jgi:YHS domain-containing protein
MTNLDQRANLQTDPVCGMTVNPEDARAKGLSTTYEGREYVFCGRGCFLDFAEDPARFLRSDYVPHM